MLIGGNTYYEIYNYSNNILVCHMTEESTVYLTNMMNLFFRKIIVWTLFKA